MAEVRRKKEETLMNKAKANLEEREKIQQQLVRQNSTLITQPFNANSIAHIVMDFIELSVNKIKMIIKVVDMTRNCMLGYFRPM